jgi:hypothetical protein
VRSVDWSHLPKMVLELPRPRHYALKHQIGSPLSIVRTPVVRR